MDNINYTNGIIQYNYKDVANVHKPFHSRLDRVSQKSSLEKLIVSPDESVNSSQIKRYVVPLNNRYAYKMHATYRGSLKCHNVYATKGNKLLKNNIMKFVMCNIDQFDGLKADLSRVISLIINSWNYDCIVTDIPWIGKSFRLPVLKPQWQLTDYKDDLPYHRAIKLLLKKYNSIPLNNLPFECLDKLSLYLTNINQVDYACPLILMNTNSSYSGYLARVMGKGLPCTLFKI